MINCLPCERVGRKSTVVSLCLQCGAMLCEAHVLEPPTGPGGMNNFGCTHAIRVAP
jgi:hypothetical protein